MPSTPIVASRTTRPCLWERRADSGYIGSTLRKNLAFCVGSFRSAGIDGSSPACVLAIASGVDVHCGRGIRLGVERVGCEALPVICGGKWYWRTLSSSVPISAGVVWWTVEIGSVSTTNCSSFCWICVTSVSTWIRGGCERSISGRVRSGVLSRRGVCKVFWVFGSETNSAMIASPYLSGVPMMDSEAIPTPIRWRQMDKTTDLFRNWIALLII